MPRLSPTLELVRPINCLLAGVAVLIGVIVTAGRWDLPGMTILSPYVVAIFVAAGGNAINDYFDRDIDKVNRPKRPIPSGRISASEALSTAQILFIIGIMMAVFINVYCVILAALNSLVLVIYSWGLKRQGLVGNLSIGYLVGSTFLFGGLASGIPENGLIVPSELLVLVLMAALSTIGRELIKDIEDMRGDRKLKFKTFPLRHGARKAAILAIGFIAVAIAISPLPYLLGIFGIAYLALLVPSVVAFIVAAVIIARGQDPKYAKRASLACKVAMGLGLLAFLAGVVANVG